jgi:hypothetical protein
MLHTTSDLLGLRREGNEIIMTLSGDRDLAGEAVLEGPGAGRKRTEIGGRPAETGVIRGRKVITYSHDTERKFSSESPWVKRCPAAVHPGRGWESNGRAP